MEEYMVPCMNKSIFGIDCMGCGTQRSLNLLLQGEFVEAFKMFPAIYTLLLFGITITLHLIDKKRNYLKPIAILAITNGIIMTVNYFYKILIN
ncbi:DUF2752 domain-containing protein [uncultured Flavobacterium sp.]|uniref:DUF2752 domain-containing protein n=1 Tax=uncultured Flavobacterium sp. TaxID=165435 RepID=UPI0030C87712